MNLGQFWCYPASARALVPLNMSVLREHYLQCITLSWHHLSVSKYKPQSHPWLRQGEASSSAEAQRTQLGKRELDRLSVWRMLWAVRGRQSTTGEQQAKNWVCRWDFKRRVWWMEIGRNPSPAVVKVGKSLEVIWLHSLRRQGLGREAQHRHRLGQKTTESQLLAEAL